METKKIVRKRRDYEFRMDTARKVVEGGRNVKDIANEIGQSDAAVKNWVMSYQYKKATENVNPDDHRLKAANEEISKLTTQLAFLKKTMAHFVTLV